MTKYWYSSSIPHPLCLDVEFYAIYTYRVTKVRVSIVLVENYECEIKTENHGSYEQIEVVLLCLSAFFFSALAVDMLSLFRHCLLGSLSFQGFNISMLLLSRL